MTDPDGAGSQWRRTRIWWSVNSVRGTAFLILGMWQSRQPVRELTGQTVRVISALASIPLFALLWGRSTLGKRGISDTRFRTRPPTSRGLYAGHDSSRS